MSGIKLLSNVLSVICARFISIIDNMILRAAVVLFAVLMIHRAVADPQVNISLLFSKIGINKPKLK